VTAKPPIEERQRTFMEVDAERRLGERGAIV